MNFEYLKISSNLIQDFYINNYVKIRKMGFYPPDKLEIHPIYNITCWDLNLDLPEKIIGTFDIFRINISSFYGINKKYRLSLMNNDNSIIYLRDGSFYDLNFSKGYFDTNEISEILNELIRIKIYLGFCKRNLNMIFKE